MGFTRVAERHLRVKAEEGRVRREEAAADAKKNRIKPSNPWKSHGGAELPAKVELLDRIYKPVLNAQVHCRARQKDADAKIPQAMRQWRWTGVNPQGTDFAWCRTDHDLHVFERCPVCGAESGQGAHRLHLGRHTIKELQQQARHVGVAEAIVRATAEQRCPEQTKEALITILLEARHFKKHLHSAWRKHTSELNTTLKEAPMLHESALRRELEALTPTELVERAEATWADVKTAEEDEDEEEEETEELGTAHATLVDRLVQLTPPPEDEFGDPVKENLEELEEELRLKLAKLTPTILLAQAKELEMDKYTMDAAVVEEALLVNMIMEMSPDSLAYHAGEAGASVQEVYQAVQRGGVGYEYTEGERQEGELGGPLRRASGPAGYFDNPGANPEAARAELTKLVKEGSHRYATPHPKHTEHALQTHLLTADGKSFDAHESMHEVSAITTKYMRRGGPMRSHPKYRRISHPHGYRPAAQQSDDIVPIVELRLRAAARGISEGVLIELQHQYTGENAGEREAILALLMEEPGHLSHLTADTSKGTAFVRRELMSMSIPDLRERLLTSHERQLLTEEEQDLEPEQRREITLQRLAEKDRRDAPEFIAVEWPKPEDEDFYDVDYTRKALLKECTPAPPAWNGGRDGYVFKKDAQGLGYYKDPAARDEDIERGKLVREILGPLAVGMNLPTADEFVEYDADEGFADETEAAVAVKPTRKKGVKLKCWGKPGCVNPKAGLHHKGCPCIERFDATSPAAIAAAAADAAVPATTPAWLQKAVSHAAGSVASQSRAGCDLPSNQRNIHRWQPIGDSMCARSDRRPGFQKMPKWDQIAAGKGGLAAAQIGPSGARQLVGPSIGPFDEGGRHIQGDGERRLKRMIDNRKLSGQPPARHEYWLDKHSFGSKPKAQLPPDPTALAKCEECGKRHKPKDGCTDRIHFIISRDHHRIGGSVDVELQHGDPPVKKIVAVPLRPRQPVPFDVDVESADACPFGAVITIGTTVEVGHSAALHIEALHSDNRNTLHRGSKGDRRLHTVPLGNGLTTESHSHRVIPGSELKPPDSESDEEDETEVADVALDEGPTAELVQWNAMSTEKRAVSMEAFRQLCDGSSTESKSAALEERLLGIASAAERYTRAAPRAWNEQAQFDEPPDEEAAIRSSLQTSGVFADLGRRDLLNGWSDGEWDEFRAMQLDLHAAEGDKALMEGCVGTMAVGPETADALLHMANAAMGVATMAGTPRIEAH